MNVTFETKHKNKGGTNEWLTPPEIIKALGEFDLDPCCPIKMPWNTAKKHYTIIDDGLKMPWEGRVWCNPPYGDEAPKWIEKCASHGNAMVLTFARTETKMFFNHIWNKADAVLFIKGRLNFYTVNGIKASSAGAPSVLIAYGKENAKTLQNCNVKGKFVRLK